MKTTCRVARWCLPARTPLRSHPPAKGRSEDASSARFPAVHGSPQPAAMDPIEVVNVPPMGRRIPVKIRETDRNPAIDCKRFAKPPNVQAGFSKNPGKD